MQSKNIWIYREGKGDYGFIDVIKDGVKKGYYVHFKNKKDALDGDEVSFGIVVFKGKEEAIVDTVEKREKKVLVGTLQKKKTDFWFVVFDTTSFKQDAFIPAKYMGKAKHGDKVAVSITSWKGKNPEGKIVEILTGIWEDKIDIMAIAYAGGARINFPERVKEEAKKVSIEKRDTSKRLDLRKLFTFTIDGEDAKDLDDAISIIELSNGHYKLYVHIADVAEYVREKSFLDEEALKRTTSIYMADRVIPMLPEELSNGVCSLSAGTDKLTLTCEMEIDQNGNTVFSKVYESIIHSNYRLTYSEVEKIRQEDFIHKDLGEVLKASYTLKKIIEKKRLRDGYIEFEFDESKIIVDKDSFPIAIKKYERLESHKVIEHFMITANEAVGKKFKDIPFLYRIHPDPDSNDIDKMLGLLSNYLPIDLKKDTLVDAIRKAKGNNFLSRLILRTLSKARYSPINEGHFWLGLDFYSHFTSPIRRYPDLQIHRIIKEKIKGDFTKTREIHYKKILTEVGDECSAWEEKSEKIERSVDDLMKVKFMSDKIGQEFEGRISWMIPKWFFIELENTVEGFVDIFSLEAVKGKYIFSDFSLTFENTITWEKFKFGDPVKVRLKSVDEKMRRIDFDVV